MKWLVPSRPGSRARRLRAGPGLSAAARSPAPEAWREQRAGRGSGFARRPRVVGALPGRGAPRARAGRARGEQGPPDRGDAGGPGAGPARRRAVGSVPARSTRAPARPPTGSRRHVPPRGQGGRPTCFATTVDLTFEIDIWGRLRRATRGGPRRAPGQRGGPARGGDDARQRRRHRRTSELRQLDLELETTRSSVASRRGSLQHRPRPLRGRADLRARSAPGRGRAREHGRADPRSGAADRPDREPAQHPARPQPGRDRPRPAAHRADLPARRCPPGCRRRSSSGGRTSGRPRTALVAANARIGVAKAAFFPQISLTGFFGVESVALSDLFTGPSRIWQFGPTRDRADLQRRPEPSEPRARPRRGSKRR